MFLDKPYMEFWLLVDPYGYTRIVQRSSYSRRIWPVSGLILVMSLRIVFRTALDEHNFRDTWLLSSHFGTRRLALKPT